MDFKNILGKLSLLESKTTGPGPKFPGQWKGTDAGTPGKKIVGDSIELDENLLRDLHKGPTAKTKEQELAEAYQEFLENEEQGINPDTMLTFLRDAFKNINDRRDAYSTDGFDTMYRIYQELRRPLMKGDISGFEESWDYYSGQHPDAFDEFMGEAYDIIGVGTYEEFMKAATDVGLSEDDLGVNPKRPGREGARHARGHEPIPGYKTVKQDTEESRGHKIIANHLKDKEAQSRRVSDAEAYQAHIDRMKAKMKEYQAANPNSIYKKVDEYGANQPTGTAGQKMVQTAMPTTQDVAAQNGNDPQKAASVAQATQTIKSASGATAPNDVIAKALDAVSKGQQVSPQDMKTLEPVLKNVAAAGQDPTLANDYKTLANKAKIFQQTQK